MRILYSVTPAYGHLLPAAPEVFAQMKEEFSDAVDALVRGCYEVVVKVKVIRSEPSALATAWNWPRAPS